MSEVTVQEAKTQLSRLLRRVEAGEEIVIRRGREPVALLTRAPRRGKERRVWGTLEGRIHDDFDAPMEELDPYS